MLDIVIALSMKLWWQLRTGNSLWVTFMGGKYSCKVHLTNCVKKMGVSSTWLRLIKVKERAEFCIKWLIGKGTRLSQRFKIQKQKG